MNENKKRKGARGALQECLSPDNLERSAFEFGLVEMI